MEKVIKNGLVFDAIHEEPYTADILVKDGKIAAIGENLDAPGAEVIDASGQHVYPGFVDAHSHLGMIDSGMGFEGSDCNEPTDPLTPQLRGLDGFYAMDPDVHTAAAAGVTGSTSSVPPAESSRVMSLFNFSPQLSSPAPAA